MPTEVELAQQAQDLQAQLAAITAQITEMRRVKAWVNSQRPTGIDATWLPAYEGTLPNVRITAWFDPIKYGTGFKP